MKKQLMLSLAVSASLLAACSSLIPVTKYNYKESAPTMRLALLPQDTIAVGKTVDIQVKLNDIKTLDLIKDANLDSVHTQKIHLLIIDPTLTDYQHIHSEPTNIPGLYHFKFTPKMPGGYRVWADVTPSATHKQEYVMANLGHPGSEKVDKKDSADAAMNGYHFTLSFDKPPVEGGESVGTIHITGANVALQPVMGAYGHIVGFYDDFRTVVHIHPMGDEPKTDKDRGGPDLTFHLMPVKPGFVKLFAQVEINNKEMYVPFGVIVKPQGAK